MEAWERLEKPAGSFTAPSVLSCGMKCSMIEQSCGMFHYDKIEKICTLAKVFLVKMHYKYFKIRGFSICSFKKLKIFLVFLHGRMVQVLRRKDGNNISFWFCFLWCSQSEGYWYQHWYTEDEAMCQRYSHSYELVMDQTLTKKDLT